MALVMRYSRICERSSPSSRRLIALHRCTGVREFGSRHRDECRRGDRCRQPLGPACCDCRYAAPALRFDLGARWLLSHGFLLS